MLQIILQILAIIGIILLVLVSLLVLSICLVLFVPIRYRIEGDIDTITQTYLGRGKATWLLHVISVTGGYPTPGTITIKIFGYPFKVIKLKDSEDKEDVSSDIDQTNGNEIVKKNSMSQPESDAKAPIAPSISVQADEPKTEKHEGGAFEDAPTEMEDKKKQSVFSKWYHKIIYTIRNLCDKIKEIWNTIQYYKDVLDEKQTYLFIDRSKKRLFKLLKAISPKRLQGNLKVGTGSPDTTGYLLAIYGMLVPYLDKRFSLEPDFEEAICAGWVIAKGKIYLLTALTVVLGFATDKQLSILLKKLKREEQ